MTLENRARRRAAMQPKQLKAEDRMRRNPILGAAVVVLLVGLVFELRNIFSVIDTLQEYPQAEFWDIFFSTIGEDGEHSGILWMFVWIPIIALGVAAALFVLHLVIGGKLRSRADEKIAEENAAVAQLQQQAQQAQQPWNGPGSPQQHWNGPGSPQQH